MPRLPHFAAALAAALLSLAACGDPSQPTATGLPSPPDAPRAVISAGAACTRTDAQYLQQQIGTLFTDADLRRRARTLESTLEGQCAAGQNADGQPKDHPNVATNAAIDYLAFLLTNRAKRAAGVTDASYWAYAVRVFRYVDYTLPDNPAVLSNAGDVKICTSGVECIAKGTDGDRAIKVFQNALSTVDGVRYVLTLAPADCGTQLPSGVPLPKIGLCADISVDPKKTPSFDFATHPGAIVDVCMNKDAKQFLYASLTDPYGDDVVQGKLAQRSPNASGYDPISLRTRPVAGLLTSADCDSDPLTTSPPSGQAIGSALSRLGHAVLALFTPQTAHASHGGLGTMPGFADDLSIFGGLDGYLFNATFEQDAVGTYPQSGPGYDELRGTWEPNLEPNPSPSVVTVQAAAAPFNSRYVLLNQAGGNAAAKPPLTFTARLPFSATAFEAGQSITYRVRFRAAVLSPRAQDAVFVLRTSAGLEIGRFVFNDASQSQSGPITFQAFGGPAVRTSVADGWARGQVKSYEAVLTFTRGTGVALSAASVKLGFVGATPRVDHAFAAGSLPQNLSALGWVLDNKDGAIVAFDDLQVFVEPTAPAP